MLSVKKKQQGITSVEFAIVGGIFFTVLFAIIEFGRFMFVMNTLDEITRRGARLAAVCPVDAGSVSYVQNQAMFNGTIVGGLTSNMIDVSYWEDDGTEVVPDAADPDSSIPSIDYVRVGINGYQHQMLIPAYFLTIPVPDFSTTIPSESLGVHPDGSLPSCT